MNAPVLAAAVAALVLVDGADTGAPGALVWKSAERLEKGVNETFVARGTRQGHRYLFRARSLCKWQPQEIWTPTGLLHRERTEPIFGIEFRVSLGLGHHRFLKVGEGKPEQTELEFVADGDDVSIHIEDHWPLDEEVLCVVDGLEVVNAPENEPGSRLRHGKLKPPKPGSSGVLKISI